MCNHIRIQKIARTIQEAHRFLQAMIVLGVEDIRLETGGYWENRTKETVYCQVDYCIAQHRGLKPSHKTVMACVDGRWERIKPVIGGEHPGYLVLSGQATFTQF